MMYKFVIVLSLRNAADEITCCSCGLAFAFGFISSYSVRFQSIFWKEYCFPSVQSKLFMRQDQKRKLVVFKKNICNISTFYMVSGTRSNNNLLNMYLFTRETLGDANLKILITLRTTVSCCMALIIFVAMLAANTT